MSKIQLDRLRKDLEELNEYITKITKRGNMDLVTKLKRKRDFLESKLATA
jgi:uncharacterized membrane protein (DUF106 family)